MPIKPYDMHFRAGEIPFVDRSKNLVRGHVNGFVFHSRGGAHVARIIYEIIGDYGKRDTDIKRLVPKTDCCVVRNVYELAVASVIYPSSREFCFKSQFAV